MFFFANAFGCGMYILGAVEAFLVWTGMEVTGNYQADMRILSYLVLALLVSVNYVGLNVKN